MSRSLEGGISATLFTALESGSAFEVPGEEQSHSFPPSDADDSHSRRGAYRSRRQLRLLVVTGVALLAAASAAGALLVISPIASFGRWRSGVVTLDSIRLDATMDAQLLAITGPSANACGALDDDVDFEYTNVAGLGHLDSIGSSQECCRLCQGEPTCKAFTWVKDAKLLIGNPGQCWLKGGGFIRKKAKQGVYSGFVRDEQLEASFAKEEKSAHQLEARGGSEGKTTKLATTTTMLDETTVAKPLTAVAKPITTVTPVTITTAPITSTMGPSTWPPTNTTNLAATTPPPEAAPPQPPHELNKPCCSFEPLMACGDELGISRYCDVSKRRCEADCAGKWLEGGPQENPHGIDLDADYVPNISDAQHQQPDAGQVGR